jgi:predicted RNase H-like HicB family nuclease
MERGFKVILEWDREGNAYHVSVPALPGCFTYGRTREEALQRAKEAIQGHLKGLKLIGEPIPFGEQVRPGIEAPPDVTVYREELAGREPGASPEEESADESGAGAATV